MTPASRPRLLRFAEFDQYSHEESVKITQDHRFWKRVTESKLKKLPGLNDWRLHKILATLYHGGSELYQGTLPEGITLFGSYRDFDVRMWATQPSWTRGLVKLLSDRLLQHPGAFIDVGANLGMVSSLVAKQGKPETILAVEANPSTARIAARALHANGVTCATLAICAVSDQPGEMEFHFTPFHSGGASLGATSSKVPDTIVKVPVTTLDHLVEESGTQNVSVVKIDVEGFEPEVVRGALGTIQTHRPMMVLEFNQMVKQRGVSYESLFSPIRDFSYDLFWLTDGQKDLTLQPESEVNTGEDFGDIVCIPR
ncbi:MAG: FkbM family methyltransferase [Fimbriimonadaceae bacterium]|jgi:FkbM family methyltransferase|nr:FkbM family methyltransferase [Fimbriimonadaceae bacterium]